LRRLLDRGRLADPSGDERRVTPGIERRSVSDDLGVTLGDRLAQVRSIILLAVLCQGGAVAGLRDALQRVGEVCATELLSEEAVDRPSDRLLANVEGRRVGNALQQK
jgi:hypothetical protein